MKCSELLVKLSHMQSVFKVGMQSEICYIPFWYATGVVLGQFFHYLHSTPRGYTAASWVYISSIKQMIFNCIYHLMWMRATSFVKIKQCNADSRKWTVNHVCHKMTVRLQFCL